MEPGIPVLRLINALLRRRHIIARTVLCAALFVAIPSLIRPRMYSSSASFVPQAKSLSAAAGLAAQFGITGLAQSDPSQSPPFYADLLQSRSILEDAVNTQYAATVDGRAVQLSYGALHDVKGPTPARRLEAAVEMLRKRTSVALNQRTGVIDLSVSDEDPRVAIQLTNRLLDLLNHFNLEIRQSRASAERKFTEARLAAARADLRSAEDRQQIFLQSNRDYRNSPSLLFQYNRLDQEVQFRQSTLTSIAQLYESARIDEIRDTPVLTIVEAPELPARPDSRGLIKRVILGIFFGFFLSVFVIAAVEFFRRWEEELPTLSVDFLALRRATRRDLVRPWRLLRSVRTS